MAIDDDIKGIYNNSIVPILKELPNYSPELLRQITEIVNKVVKGKNPQEDIDRLECLFIKCGGEEGYDKTLYKFVGKLTFYALPIEKHKKPTKMRRFTRNKPDPLIPQGDSEMLEHIRMRDGCDDDAVPCYPRSSKLKRILES